MGDGAVLAGRARDLNGECSQPALSHDQTTAVVKSLVQERKSSANAAAFSEAPSPSCPM